MLKPGQTEESPAPGVLRPSWLARLGVMVPCGILVGSTFTAWATSPSDLGLQVAILMSLASAYVILRAIFFVGVRRDGAFLVVRGNFWSRRIRIARIERVTDFHVFVWWRTRAGVRIFTPLAAFSAQEGTIETVARVNRAAISEIRRWVEQDRMERGDGQTLTSSRPRGHAARRTQPGQSNSLD